MSCLFSALAVEVGWFLLGHISRDVVEEDCTVPWAMLPKPPGRGRHRTEPSMASPSCHGGALGKTDRVEGLGAAGGLVGCG